MDCRGHDTEFLKHVSINLIGFEVSQKLDIEANTCKPMEKQHLRTLLALVLQPETVYATSRNSGVCFRTVPVCPY